MSYTWERHISNHIVFWLHVKCYLTFEKVLCCVEPVETCWFFSSFIWRVVIQCSNCCIYCTWWDHPCSPDIHVVLLHCRKTLLSYLLCNDDKLVMASLCLSVSFLQNEGTTYGASTSTSWSCAKIMDCDWLSIHSFGTALDESLLDALGILPRRKRHKKLLLVRLSRFILYIFTQVYCLFFGESDFYRAWLFGISSFGKVKTPHSEYFGVLNFSNNWSVTNLILKWIDFSPPHLTDGMKISRYDVKMTIYLLALVMTV